MIALYWKRILIEHTNNPKTNIQARLDFTFLGVEYPPPSPHESQQANHIYYVKHKNAFTHKRISLDSGGMMLKTFFYFPVCFIQKMTILAIK